MLYRFGAKTTLLKKLGESTGALLQQQNNSLEGFDCELYFPRLVVGNFPPGCVCVIKVLGVKFDGTTAKRGILTAQSKNTNSFAAQRYTTSDQDRLKHAIKSVIYGEGIRYRRYRADRKESHLY